MEKVKTFLRRMGSGSFKRLFNNLNIVHKESGKSKILIFIDMIYSMFAYEIGYLDYLTFGFVYIGKEKRKTFMTMNDNIALVKKLNNSEYYDFFDDKLKFNNTFSKYLKRDFVDLNDGFEKFENFCQGKINFFAKQPRSFGGLGVEKIKLNENTDLKKLYNELMEKKMFLAEETIIQHPKMNELCDKSINTIRIVTILNDKGESKFVYALVRVGNGKNEVDNVTSGGMYTLLENDGTIMHPLFCDKTVTYYDVHPNNGKVFKGFKIPCFNEAVKMCKEAALVVPEMRYVGWDVAITENGPVFVEGNNLPGYDMCQNHRFHDDGCGMKEVFEKVISE